MKQDDARSLPFTDGELEAYVRILDLPSNRKLRDLLPSPVQLATLRRTIEVNRPLVFIGRGEFSFKVRPPDGWSVSLNTVEAMERRGWLQRKNFFEQWRDTRELTEKGRGLPLALWQAKVRGDSLFAALTRLS